MNNFNDNILYNDKEKTITIKKAAVDRILSADTPEKAIFLVEELRSQILETYNAGLVLDYLRNLAKATQRIVPPEEFLKKYKEFKARSNND